MSVMSSLGISADEPGACSGPNAWHAVDGAERLESRNPATGGAGLGLAIVRQLADIHGWKVEMALRPEGGLQVWLTLPIS